MFKVPKLLFTPVCAQGGGGVHLYLTISKYFPVGNSVRSLHHVYNHTYISKKNIAKISFQSGGQITKFCEKTYNQNSHNRSNNGISEKFCFKVEEYECICISEIEFEKKKILLKMAADTSFVTLYNHNAYLC